MTYNVFGEMLNVAQFNYYMYLAILVALVVGSLKRICCSSQFCI